MLPSLRNQFCVACASFATDQDSPDGRTCTSSRCFETSIPTNTMHAPGRKAPAQPCLADASLALGQLFGLVGERKVQRPRLGDGLYDPDAVNGLLHREQS